MDPQIKDQEEQHMHQKHSPRKQILVFSIVSALLILTTALVILYGKGYRLEFQKGEPTIGTTGILQATSKPTGAQVFLNERLSTSTDNSINLTPGKYRIKIAKDGYNDWLKDIQITREVVSGVNALLLPKSPSLQSISTLGVESVTVDPSGTRLAFKIASNSIKKNGIYIFDMTARSFPVLAGQGSGTQVVDDSFDVFSESEISWSPDGKQLLTSIEDKTTNLPRYYLLNTDGFNDTAQNVTSTVKTILTTWDAQKLEKDTARIKSLKTNVQNFARENFKILSWSPDETKILYQASASAEMPIFRKPRLIGNNLLYERRDLEKDAIYVYDTKEDINTRVIGSDEPVCQASITSCKLSLSWFPDSEHLVYVHDKKIEIVEDDGANMTTVYAGPFLDHYVFPWPDGSKIVILTNLGNQTTSPTLYTIGLK